KKGVRDFLRRQVAAIDLRDRKFDMTSTVEPEKLTSLVQTWKAMHKLDGAHKYEPRKAYAKGLAEIASSMGVTNTHDVEVRRQDSELGGSEQT
ncbi:hypothetical protein WHL50_14250, partial [Staphylococcus aureus]|uniref:hypothetical protein n=1 Tax=Staphylococcus aureus TaxID=1280 RepID=UPI0039BEBFD0